MSSSDNIYIVIGSLGALAVVGSILMYDKHKRHLKEKKSDLSFIKDVSSEKSTKDAGTSPMNSDGSGIKSKKHNKQHKHKNKSRSKK
jgi:hypothetical protein